MIRVAAIGDVHYDRHHRPEMRAHFEKLPEKADLLLIAGDLTQAGAPEEAQALADDLKSARLPMIAVLGNHDYHQNRQGEIQEILRNAGVIPLEGASVVLDIGGAKIGVTGIKGFGGGFFGACVTEFGEPETKSFAHHAKEQAEVLRSELCRVEADYKFALLHFSPVEATLLGEKREIYPFLGSYLLAEAIDAGGADAAFHGHAHHGVERGATPGGVPVRNVALTVIRHAYNVYMFEKGAANSTARPRQKPEPGECVAHSS